MKCPFCGHENTRVIDSRPAEENNSIRRRRVCDECDKRFTTYEKIETIPLIIIKKDNNRETYDRSKIEAGVLRACHKRPISANQINQLVDEVETEIFNMEEKEIPSQVIGELVMNKLKDLEAVAFPFAPDGIQSNLALRFQRIQHGAVPDGAVQHGTAAPLPGGDSGGRNARHQFNILLYHSGNPFYTGQGLCFLIKSKPFADRDLRHSWFPSCFYQNIMIL